MRKAYRRKGIALLCLLTVLCMGAGCKQDDGALLLPYTEQIEKDAYASGDRFFREDGLSTGICVIKDESLYDENEISAEAAVFFNINKKETIYSKDAYARLPIASLTKLMTAELALKYGDLDSTVTLGDEVVITTYDAWLCGFKPGDQVKLLDLVKAALIYSGNDAANGVAVAVGGSLEEFVSMMNQEAQLLGATGTHFANPNGLDQTGHYSTAYDVYLIFNECLKYPLFRQIIPLSGFSCDYKNADGSDVVKTFSSGNGYLNKSAQPPDGIQVFGGKTGHTETAGQCLATLAEGPDGDEYVAVVLGTETKQQVYAQTNLLLDKIP